MQQVAIEEEHSATLETFGELRNIKIELKRFSDRKYVPPSSTHHCSSLILNNFPTPNFR